MPCIDCIRWSTGQKRKVGVRFAAEHNLDYRDVYKTILELNPICEEDLLLQLKEIYL